MTTGPEDPNELVYKALCRRHRATTKGTANPMTREELQDHIQTVEKVPGG